MFTGLIQSVGSVLRVDSHLIEIRAALPTANLGDSIAVNGVCLTVAQRRRLGRAWRLVFDLSQETLSRTNLSRLQKGSPVNIEPCATLNTLLGGHLVQGHVDGIGQLDSIRRLKDCQEMVFRGPREILRYVVPKGSVAVNGVSLTAVDVSAKDFSVALIPHTLRHTNLGNLKKGDSVNLEADVLAKYVEKLLA